MTLAESWRLGAGLGRIWKGLNGIGWVLVDLRVLRARIERYEKGMFWGIGKDDKK